MTPTTLPAQRDLPVRFCRFCKRETRQWVDAKNSHVRVCVECWRRQGDGERIEIADGERMSKPPKRDSSIPPPLPPATSLDDYALRTDLNDALRRIDWLEEQIEELRSTYEERATHAKAGSNGSR